MTKPKAVTPALIALHDVVICRQGLLLVVDPYGESEKLGYDLLTRVEPDADGGVVFSTRDFSTDWSAAGAAYRLPPERIKISADDLTTSVRRAWRSHDAKHLGGIVGSSRQEPAPDKP